MRQKRNKHLLFVLSIIATLVVAFALGYIFCREEPYWLSSKELERIRIEGTYYINDSVKGQTFDETTTFCLSGKNTVTVVGHFTKDIEKNKMLIFRMDNVNVKLRVNDEEVYAFGGNESIAHSAGNLWDSIVSPGITTEDEVVITISNLYTERVNTAFSLFFEEMYAGYDNEIIRQNVSSQIINLLLSVFLICMGILVGLILLIVRQGGFSMRQALYFSGLAISGGVWFLIDFDVQNFLFPYPAFNNSLDIVLMMLMVFFLVLFIQCQLKGKFRKMMKLILAFILVTLIGASIFQVSGILDYYEIYPIVYVIVFVSAITNIISVSYEVYVLKNKILKPMIWDSLILSAGMLGDIIGIYTEISSKIFCIKISFVIFLILQFIRLIRQINVYISENAKMKMLQNMAYQDALTGVNNRRAYLEKTERLNEQKDSEYAVAVFDLNDLKEVNDTYGHDQGDYLIINAGIILKELFSKESVYRIGGDEFVVILEKEEYKKQEELLQEFVKKCYYLDIEVAYGLCKSKEIPSASYERIFREADRRMYKKKKEMKVYKESFVE